MTGAGRDDAAGGHTLTAWEVLAITGGRVVRPWSPPDRPTAGAKLDSREVGAGDVFVALPGARTDGHRHVADALQRGAGLAIITRPGAVEPPPPPGVAGGIIAVDDARRALSRLAARARDRLRGPVVAVTGSCGKTTTVRMLEAALGALGAGGASRKSFNNELGVPITLLNARRGHAFTVCEVGTNARGEIAALARVVRPDIAVITMVGRAHLGGFASADELRREKGDLAAFVRPGGVVVMNADAPPILGDLPPGVRVVTFGRGGSADARVEGVVSDASGVGFRVSPDEQAYRVPLLGGHNALNAAAAVVVGRELGLRDEPGRRAMAAGLAGVVGPPMRLQISDLGGVRVVNDAYNANPESMLAALGVLRSQAGARVAVLGDMRELGSASGAAHDEVLRSAAGVGLSRLVLIGPEMSASCARLGLEAERHPALTEEVARSIAGSLRAGEVVLLKASRSMGLEAIEAALSELTLAASESRS